MIQLTFNTTTEEILEASLLFLFRKPSIRISIFLMRAVSLLIILSFCLQYSISPSAPAQKDIVFVGAACITLFFYNLILKKIVQSKVQITHNDAQQFYSIDQTTISFSSKAKKELNIPWKKLSAIYKSNKGFLIPVVGLAYTGKFLWFPHRAFETENAQKNFSKLIAEHNIPLKEI